MRITFDDVIGGLAIFVMMAAMVFMLAWADKRERELGISGMSSERILVADELEQR
jgi:hypothetical protein